MATNFAGRGCGVVIAVGQRSPALQGIGLLGQEPGLVERLGGGLDIAHAAVEQDVVDPFAHEGVELDHHGGDGFLVALEDVDSAAALLGGGLDAELFGPFADDPLLGLHGGDQLGLDSAFQLQAVGLGDRGGGANDVESEAQGVQGRLGLARVHHLACVAEPLFDIVGQLLPGEVFRRLGLLQGRLGIGGGAGGRLVGRGSRRRSGRVLPGDPDDRAVGSLISSSPRAAAWLVGSSLRAFWKKVRAVGTEPCARAWRPRSVNCFATGESSAPKVEAPDSSTPPSIRNPAPLQSRAIRDMVDALR